MQLFWSHNNVCAYMVRVLLSIYNLSLVSKIIDHKTFAILYVQHVMDPAQLFHTHGVTMRGRWWLVVNQLVLRKMKKG